MTKYFFIGLGSFFLGVGIVGVVVPGLPTTPFLLLSAACYVRGSKRLYNWLLNHRIFGRYIRQFRENRTIPRRMKFVTLAVMWAMIGLSTLFFLHNLYLRIGILGIGGVGTVVFLLVTSGRNRKPQGSVGYLKNRD